MGGRYQGVRRKETVERGVLGEGVSNLLVCEYGGVTQLNTNPDHGVRQVNGKDTRNDSCRSLSIPHLSPFFLSSSSLLISSTFS